MLFWSILKCVRNNFLWYVFNPITHIFLSDSAANWFSPLEESQHKRQRCSSCPHNLSLSFVVQVSLHATVLLVSRGRSVRGGFATTTVWMEGPVTSLRETSQCAAVWQNILGIVAFIVSLTIISNIITWHLPLNNHQHYVKEAVLHLRTFKVQSSQTPLFHYTVPSLLDYKSVPAPLLPVKMLLGFCVDGSTRDVPLSVAGIM